MEIAEAKRESETAASKNDAGSSVLKKNGDDCKEASEAVHRPDDRGVSVEGDKGDEKRNHEGKVHVLVH